MKIKKEKAETTGLWEFLRTLPKYKLPWFWIAAAFLFNLVFNQVLLKLPTATADLLSGSLEGKALWRAISYYLIYAVLASIQTGILRITENYAVYRSRKSLWSKMLHTKVKYYDENNPGEMMSAVSNDISSAMGFLVNIIIFTLPDTFYIVQAMMKISKYHVSLALTQCAILPLKYIYMVVLGRYMSRVITALYDKIGLLTGYLAERIDNLSHIKTYNGEKKEQTHGREVSEKLYRANMNITKVDCVNHAVSALITVIEKLAVLMAAVILLQKGIITIQQWVAFFMFAAEISSKFDNFVTAWISLKQVQGSAARSVKMMNAEEEKTDGKSKGSIEMADTSVEFRNVSFAYGEHDALKNVSFKVLSGTSLCIVGLCGSGKTTALNLLERFYDVKEGEIYLGQAPICEMPLNEYRKKFSYVQQGADIFAGTIREALTYGIPKEIPDEKLMEAAELFGLGEYLKAQPKGLDTSVASSGDSLSGGQNQRLVLAREYLRDADILLMDEPTSALDMETAKKITQMIHTMFRDTTKIIVSHDLDLARTADRIAVLNNGVLEGFGTYEELMKTCILFKEMEAVHRQGKEAAK